MEQTPDNNSSKEPEDIVPEDNFLDLQNSVQFTGYGNSRKIQIVETKLPNIAEKCFGLMVPLFQPSTKSMINSYRRQGYLYKTAYEAMAKNILSVKERVQMEDDAEKAHQLTAMILEAECEFKRMVKFIKAKTNQLDAELNRGNVKVADF